MSRGRTAVGQGKGEGYPSGEEGFQVGPIHQQSPEERLRGAIGDDQRAKRRGYIPRTSASGLEKIKSEPCLICF